MATRIMGLYYAAAAMTAIAGVLHLTMASNTLGFNLNTGIFFIIAGIGQLFWVVPMVRRWGKTWYYGGIGGTVVLMVLFAITRMPDNPITGRSGQVNPMGISVELLQATFIGLSAAIIAKESKVAKIDIKTDKRTADAA